MSDLVPDSVVQSWPIDGKTITITFSDPKEAIAKARAEFAAKSDLEWVVATGAATVGGALHWGTKGDMVLHKSEHGAWTYQQTVEEVKQQILDDIA